MLLEDPSSVMTDEWSQRPRSYALSTPDSANAITIFSSGDNRGFNMSLNIGNQRPRISVIKGLDYHVKGLTNSLPDLTSLKVVPDNSLAPVPQRHKPKKRRTLPRLTIHKKRPLSFIPDDDRIELWQCAGCQIVNESTELNCKGCGGHVGCKAIAECTCKNCKIKVYLPADYERLRSDSSRPLCEMKLYNSLIQ